MYTYQDIIMFGLFFYLLGVTLTLSTQIEGKSLGQGGHKFGLGLDFDV